MDHHPFSWWDSSLSFIRVVNPFLYLPQTYSISLSFKLYTSLQWEEKEGREKEKKKEREKGRER